MGANRLAITISLPLELKKVTKMQQMKTLELINPFKISRAKKVTRMQQMNTLDLINPFKDAKELD